MLSKRIAIGIIAWLFPAVIIAEPFLKIGVIKLQTSTQAVSVSKLSDIAAKSIAVTSNVALINDGRALWFMKNNAQKLEKTDLTSLPADANWFDTVCATGNSFFVAVSDYPDEQRNIELGTPRGNFIVGPSAKGFFIVSPPTLVEYWSAPTIISRPPSSFIPQPVPEAPFSEFIQSCAWNGKEMFFGSYGSLGKINLSNASVTLLEEDEGQSLSRFPLLVEGDGMRYAIDSGGLEGTALISRSENGAVKDFSIENENEEDIVSYTALVRHQGKLFVGTSHGLFQLNEKTGSFLRLEFSQQLPDQYVTSLVSYKNFLWVFIGENWFRVDMTNFKALRYTSPLRNKWIGGHPFDSSWILLSTNGVWRSLRSTP